MKVAEVMTRYVEFLDSSATVLDAAVMMGELDVGGLPIGTEDAVQGVITDRDILLRVVAAGMGAHGPATSAMSQPVISCAEDDTVDAVLAVMAAHHIRRMPVIANRRVVGWVTLADLSRRLLIGSGILQTALQDL